MKNNHEISIPKEILDEALNKLKEVNDSLAPYLSTLTNDERRSLPKMGDKTLSFVTKSYEFSNQHPELRPSFTTQEDFTIDVADATGLLPVTDILSKLISQVEDTAMLSGSEAYNHSLLFYNNAKMAAKNSVPGAKEIYNELKNRFPSRRRKVTEQEM
ncbi:hypothetical protein [Labilibacter marinus]|uniref:hypothetical protein n=1 Tax=Labilibacter marinus TaxID=1477105 RepID=UPI00082FCEED|nr:hypothetical protein [Labilibacter marinus]